MKNVIHHLRLFFSFFSSSSTETVHFSKWVVMNKFMLRIHKQDKEISSCSRSCLSLPDWGHVLVRCSHTVTGLGILFLFLQFLDLLWNSLVPFTPYTTVTTHWNFNNLHDTRKWAFCDGPNRHNQRQTDIATLWLIRPRGLNQWKNVDRS